MRTGMTQLILDIDGLNVALPETRHEKYTAQRTPLSEDVEMATGRLVRELRGDVLGSGEVWELRYEYDYFEEALKNRVIAACEKGRHTPITCTFLTADSGGELRLSRFWVMTLQYPKFAWSKDTGGKRVPLWHGFSIFLREVEPSD